MKIDEQKFEEMLKNEMNTTEKTPFSAKIPQKQPFKLPKWSFAAAGVAAAIAIVALVGVNGMKNKNPINYYESQVSDAGAGETNQEPDEYYSGPVDNTGNSTNIVGENDRKPESWEVLKSQNLKVFYNMKELSEIEVNFSSNENRNNSLDSALDYKGLKVTKELYDLLTSEHPADERYAIELLGVGWSGTYRSWDEDKPFFADIELNGKTVGEWQDIQNEAFNREKVLIYVKDLYDYYSQGEYTEVDIVNKLLLGDIYPYDMRPYILPDEQIDKIEEANYEKWVGLVHESGLWENVRFDIDRVTAELTETNETMSTISDMLSAAYKNYEAQYSHTVEVEFVMDIDKLFKIMDKADISNSVYSYSFSIDSSMQYDFSKYSAYGVILPMSLEYFDIFAEKMSAEPDMAKVICGIASR